MSNDNGQDAQPEIEVEPDAVEQTEVDDSEAATEEQEESATSEDETPTEDRPRKDKGVGKRINELTREKYEAIRRAEALAHELEQIKSRPEPVQQTRTKPTLESCGWDPEAFAEAVAEWTIEQSFAKREAGFKEAKQREVQQAQAKEFQSRLADLEAVSPGAWEKAVSAPINTTEPMIEVIRGSEVGPHIAVWLAENLDAADEISRMSPYRAAARLGQIEAQIKASIAKPKPTVSKAPPPAPKVKGSSPVSKDPESMSMAEFAAWRNSQDKRR